MSTTSTKAVKSSGNLFWKIFAIVLLLLTIVVGILLLVGYNVMIDYDESQSYPLKYSTAVAEQFQNGNFDLLFSDSSTLSVPMIFEKEQYIESLEKLAAENEIIARKGYSPNRYDNPVYDIMAGNTRIASLQFKKTDEKSNYNFDKFEFEKITPNVKGAYAVTVKVPEGTTLYLNDKTWADELWSSIEVSDDCKTYTIKGLMNEPKIEVRYNDTDKPATLYYDAKNNAWVTKLYQVTFTVPAGSKVLVNGEIVTNTEQYIVQKGIVEKNAKTALKYVSADVSYTKYTVTGLQTLNGLTIEGTDFRGAKLEFEYDENTKEYSAGILHDVSALAYYGVDAAFVEKIAKEYSKFVMNDGDRWENLLPYVYKKSEIYETFKEFWVVFAPHDEYWYENYSLDDVTCYAENLFSARVTLEYWIKGYNHNANNITHYNVDVTFFYGYIDGKWQAVDFTLEGDPIT